ncbi:MAG: BspA family leucine-rich repeat surface protein [Lachnospiraceae bacterium]|nr:BspA family leucine-rich repeat surface protein [Lachnospiraceae bacterium]
MKITWKKILAMSCALTMLLASPGISVYGDNLRTEAAAEETEDNLRPESAVGKADVNLPLAIQAENFTEAPDNGTDGLQPADASNPAGLTNPEDSENDANPDYDVAGIIIPGADADNPPTAQDPGRKDAEDALDTSVAFTEESDAEENDDLEVPSDETANVVDDSSTTETTALGDPSAMETNVEDDSSATEIEVKDDSSAMGDGEQTVGTSFEIFKDYNLGNNVTAHAYGQYGLGLTTIFLDLTFNNGTLPTDWKEKLSQAPWDKNSDWRESVDFIDIKIASGKGYLPADSSHLFSGITSVFQINLEGIDTSKVTTMASMFYNCESLEHVIFGNVNTAKVTDMSGMFSRCYSLTDVDFSNLNTSNVKNMSSMFFKCSSLTNPDLSSFKTSKVTHMTSMFYECCDITTLSVSGFDTSNVIDMTYMFARCSSLVHLYLGTFNTSKVTSMAAMFQMCDSLTEVFANNLKTQNVTDFSNMFSYCSSLEELDMRSVDTSKAKNMDEMFRECSKLKKLDISGFDTSHVENKDMANSGLLTGCTSLVEIRTPKVNDCIIGLPKTMYDVKGKSYKMLPKLTESILLRDKPFKDISKANISGISLSYGYTGVFVIPSFTVMLDGATLAQDVDYTYMFYNNLDPGIARLEIEGIGNYGGTKIKTFEIVDCVSSLVDGGTYQLIPKNNSKTAVCSYSGKMVNNTKVYITDRSASEAMRFIAKKNTDGSWKFINAKCELTLAIQQNSAEAGKGLVLYDQTKKPMQNWRIERKSDNSFAIKSAVTGLSISMSDPSAVKGTTLSMEKSASSGLQRFYFASADPIKTPYRGTYSIHASKNKSFAVTTTGGILKEGANIALYKYAKRTDQQFLALYSGGGYYRFVNLKTGMVITAASASAESNVVQKTWAGTNAQRWKFMKLSDGTYRLLSASGYALHLNGNSAADGTNIMARTPSTSGAQKWYMLIVK